MDCVDAVEQVLAEQSAVGHLFYFLVGGAYQPYVDGDASIASYRGDAAALQRVEQLRLLRKRQVAYFVEKKRASVGLFHKAFPRRFCVGERSFNVSEQLAFEERPGYCAHIHGHEFLCLSHRPCVQFVCQQILAGAVLSGNQHVGIGGGNFLHRVVQTFHHRCLSPVHFGRCPAASGKFAPPTVGHLQRFYKLAVVPRFHHKVERSVFHSPYGKLHIGIGREQHYRDFRKVAVYLVQPEQPFVAAVDS